MKHVKKFILVLVVMFTFVAALPLSGIAATINEEQAYNAGYDIYKAWYYQNYSSYGYMVNQYTSPYTSTITERENSAVYKGLLAAWRVAIFDLESEIEYAEKEVSYYETVLFDLLYDSSTGGIFQSFLSDYSDAAGITKKTFSAISASTMKKIAALCEGLEASTPASSELAQQAYANMQSFAELKDAFGLIGTTMDYISNFETFTEYLEGLCKVQALVNASSEINAIITDMYNKCDNSNPALKEALRTFATYTKQGVSKEIAIAVFTGQKVATVAAEEIASELYKSVLAKAKLNGLAVAAGQATGKFLANTIFGTSDAIASYYELRAVKRFEDLLRSEVQSLQNGALSNSATARKFNTAYVMLCKTYNYGLDTFKKFVDKNYKNGTLAEIFPGVADDEYKHFNDKMNGLQKVIASNIAIDESTIDIAYNEAAKIYGGFEMDDPIELDKDEIGYDNNNEEIKNTVSTYYLYIDKD